ncbi:MAG: sodium:solute symporter family protein, partial [Actinomycetes bacterium]
AVALVFAIAYPTVIVNLLLTSYDGVTQFFPAVALSLVWRRTSKAGVAAGILVGVGLVLYLVVSKHDPVWGLNAGIVALAANAVVTVLGSLAFPARRRDDPLEAYKPAGKGPASRQPSAAGASTRSG